MEHVPCRRYVRGNGGSGEEARAKLIASARWRKVYGVKDILSEKSSSIQGFFPVKEVSLPSHTRILCSCSTCCLSQYCPFSSQHSLAETWRYTSLRTSPCPLMKPSLSVDLQTREIDWLDENADIQTGMPSLLYRSAIHTPHGLPQDQWVRFFVHQVMHHTQQWVACLSTR